MDTNFINVQVVVEKLPVHVWWKNKDLVYLGCNAKVLQALGLSSYDEFIGKTDHDLWSKGIAERLWEADNYVLCTGKEIKLEELIERHDGKRLIMLTVKSPLFDSEGKVAGIIGTSSDISDRKEMEAKLLEAKLEAENASKAKTEFLANMSHDIRTPLTGMASLTEYLYKCIPGGELKGLAHQLMELSRSLVEVSNSLIEAAQSETGNLPVAHEVFNLRKMLSSVQSLLVPAIQAKHLEFKIFCEGKLPSLWVGDSKRIRRIMLNLIGNAIKFTYQGFIHVSVQIKPANNPMNKILEIKVQDTGIGIPKDKQKQIFERFTRLTSKEELAQYRSFGIGLSIVDQFVKDLKGVIEVDSKENQGSTFTCILPIEQPTAEEMTSFLTFQEEKAEYFKTSGFPSLRILVIEDNKIATFSICHQIKQYNFEVDVAEKAEEAIRLYEKNKYDLIFTDLGLPDKDGYWVSNTLRDLERRNQLSDSLPAIIIGLSAHLGEAEIEQCKRSKMNECILKPLNQEVFSQILMRYFGAGKIEKGKLKQEKMNEESGTAQVIDLKTCAKEFYSNDMRAAQRMLNYLMETLSCGEEKLKAEFDKKNWEKFYYRVHNLYGGCVSCGVPRLVAALGSLKNSLRKKTTEDIEILFQKVLKEIQILKETFASLT